MRESYRRRRERPELVDLSIEESGEMRLFIM